MWKVNVATNTLEYTGRWVGLWFKRDRTGNRLNNLTPVERAVILKLRDLKGKATLEELINSLSDSNFRFVEAIKVVYGLREKGVLALLDPQTHLPFTIYVLSSRATWFWLLTALITLTVAVISSPIQEPPVTYLRYVLGSFFILYLPGEAAVEALYPRKEELSQLERLAYSLGISLALVPLVGLLLKYIPFGIRLTPLVATLTALTLITSLIALYRKYKSHMLSQREFLIHLENLGRNLSSK